MDTNNSVDTVDELMCNRVIAVNFTAPVLLSKAVIDTMLQQGSGCIFNVASKAGISGSATGVAYTASKHGIVSSVRSIEVVLPSYVSYRSAPPGILLSAFVGKESDAVLFPPTVRGSLRHMHPLTDNLRVATNIVQSVDQSRFDKEATTLIS